MAAKSSQEPTKLQIPVTRELANELARWAQNMEVTQAVLCKALLEFAMDDPTNIGEWLKVRAIGKRPKRMKSGWLQRGDASATRLQILVPEELAQRIEQLATRLNHSPVRLAALLLDFSLADEKWGMRFLSTRMGKGILSILGKRAQAYESAECEEER